jgi:hypothetical protein
MAEPTLHDFEYVVTHGVSPTACESVLEAVGHCHLRHTYDQGLQPDESYYVQREAEVRGRDEYRPGVAPPPDLVIEVDVTDTCLPRLPVFAKVGVPEIRRYGKEGLQLYRLTDDGEYQVAERSEAFPFVTAADLARLLEQRRETDENSVIRTFVDCARTASSQ